MKDKMEKWVEEARTAIKWVAVDKNGEIYGYAEQPILRSTSWGEGRETTYIGFTRDKELIKNWDKTLRNIE